MSYLGKNNTVYISYSIKCANSMCMCLCVPGKAVVSMPVGGPAVMNNYMIAQPPGFQLATFVSAALCTAHAFILAVLYIRTRIINVPGYSD